ncbi:MAG: DUF4838 domain-containing protein, partial [Lentisphaeria bacterium]|nr:DUF4838 domain-containing protein [Lentisphaeria bacterium]
MKKTFVLFSSALFCAIFSLSGADIVRDGKAQVSFVLPEESSLKRIPFLQSRHAAGEITDYVKKITGADLSSAKDVPGRICLLAGKDAEKLLSGKKMSPEGFVISSTEKDIVIASPTMLGVLYGAYTLLEKYAGVRWLFPGEEGEYYPKKATLTVPPGEFVSNPSFPERSMSPTGGNSYAGLYGAKKTWQFLSRNKVRFGVYERSARDPKLLKGDEYLFTLGGYLQPGGHETFYRSVPDTLLKTHPEYFCLVNGERLPQHHPTVKMGGCTYAQVCTSQEGVNSLIADFINRTLEHGKEKSYPTSFLYGAGDNCTTWCHCATCEKLFDNYAPDRFYYMVNKSAEKVFAKHPDAKLCSWIYSDFRKLPRRIVPDRRLHYTFCDHGRCYTHELSDPGCAINKAMLQLMNDWEKLVGPLKVYEYYCVGQPYAPHEVILARDLKYYFARKWSGYHDEIS